MSTPLRWLICAGLLLLCGLSLAVLNAQVLAAGPWAVDVGASAAAPVDNDHTPWNSDGTAAGSVSNRTETSAANRDSLRDSQGILVWNNGDRLAGNIVSGNTEVLTWQADRLFRDPLQLDLNFLSEIQFSGESIRLNQGFLVRTIDRCSWLGELVSFDAEHLVLRSPRFGEIQLKRESIFSIVNLANSNSQIVGEMNLDDWQFDRGQKKDWSINGQGHLCVEQPNSQIYRKLEFPELTLFTIDLQWNKKLDLIFAFGVPANRTKLDDVPRIETWDDSLVLSHKDSFEIISESIDQKSKRLKLIVHWDRKNNKMVIYNERGDQLTVAELGEYPSQVAPGILIENKGSSLTISELSSRTAQAGFDATRPSVQLLSQSAVNLNVISFDGTQWQATAPDQTTQSIPAADFCGAYLINPIQERPPNQLVLEFFDGMFVTGQLQQIEAGKIRLQTPHTVEPVLLTLDQMRNIKFAGAGRSDTAADSQFAQTLKTKEGTIRGRLESGSGASDDVVRWLAPGARLAIPFAQGDSLIRVREKTPESTTPPSQFRDTLYLHNRDVIPANVIALDEHQVTIESFIEKKSIPTAMIRAIDFGSVSGSTPIAIDDPAWYFKQPKRMKTMTRNNQLRVTGNEGVGHPSLMETGAFSFDFILKENDYSSAKIMLLVKNLAEPQALVDFTILWFQNNLQVADSSTFQSSGGVPVRDKARISVHLEDSTIVVSCNQKVIYRQKVQLSPEMGRGVYISSDGNDANFANFTQDFDASRRHAFVDQDRKQLLLTVPRLKKNAPPKNIVCAKNSDLLRGDVVRLTDRALWLRSNEEEKQYPRSLISTIIWPDLEPIQAQLAAEAALAAAATDENAAEQTQTKAPVAVQTPPQRDRQEQSGQQTAQVLLNNSRQITLTLESWVDDILHGSSPVLGKCAIPLAEIYELRMGSFADQASDMRYADWVSKLAPAPKLETAGSESNLLFGQQSALIGTVAAGFTVKTLGGQTISLSEYQGKVVVLDFWATWCGPCVVELPKLEAVAKQFPADQVALIALNQEEPQETVAEFLAERDLDLTVGLDDGQVGRRYQASSLPTTIVIDRKGKIAFVNVGAQPENEMKLKRAIEKLLE